MEAFKEAIAASKEQACIFKGNQTKQQCPQSPIPLSISPLIHSSSERVREEETTALDESKNNALGNDLAKHRKDDEEDLSIAKCLILLSQGHSLAHNNRFSSRRFLETSSSSNGAGYYVYQCKTCDRTFSSFQALGGHRASHKKPKATYSKFDLKNNIYQNGAVSLVSSYNNKNSNDRSLVSYGNKTSNNRVHECGICGTEFTSGQALGGHMRRHRGAVVVTAVPPIVTVANTELSLSPMSFDQDHVVMPERKRAKNTVVSLDLDLNLPAPEDENRVNGFSFGSKQEYEQEHMKQREEPKSLVFSAPTLVDCHY